MSIGGAIAIPVALYGGTLGNDLKGIGLSGALLLLPAILISLIWAFDLFFTGLQSVPAGVATFLELITPLVALVLGVVILSEVMSWTQLIAIPPFIYCIIRISQPGGLLGEDYR